MGIIDRYDWTLTCEACGSSEQMTALDKGSQSGSCWRGPEQPKLFQAVINGTPYGPEVESAVCSQCGKAATVTARQ